VLRSGDDVPGESWLDARLVVRPSTIHGRGLFAAHAIARDELVMVLGGETTSDDEVRGLIARGDRYDGIALGQDVNLRIKPGDWPGIHGNHSCDPNLWLTGLVQVSTRRDVDEGEEVVADYATYTMSPDWSMSCSCGSPLCRGVVTGDDWRRPDLQARYFGHFAPVIARRIDESRSRY
jgi:hypothetical protein